MNDEGFIQFKFHLVITSSEILKPYYFNNLSASYFESPIQIILFLVPASSFPDYTCSVGSDFLKELLTDVRRRRSSRGDVALRSHMCDKGEKVMDKINKD